MLLLLVGAGVGGFLLFTDQGKQLLAQLTGGGFATYDPKKTDLFPYAGLLENSRKEAQDFIGDLLEADKKTTTKGLQAFDRSKVTIPPKFKGSFNS